MKTINSILSCIEEITYCAKPRSDKKQCEACQWRLVRHIRYFVQRQLPIEFVLPAFPAKSGNRNKTLSELPDLGEKLAFERLNALICKIKQCYLPGANIIICSDGHVFNDVVHVSEQSVSQYQKTIKHLCKINQFNDIRFFDLYDFFGPLKLEFIRERLIQQFGKPLDEIKKDVLNIEEEKKLFNGLHRFLFEDLKYFYPDLSPNAVKKMAKHNTYLTIQRSHAWSNLVAIVFKDAIRLSIHPHACTTEKITVQLVSSDTPWATPWHNVTVKTGAGIKLLKKREALHLGARLMKANSFEAHYVL